MWPFNDNMLSELNGSKLSLARISMSDDNMMLVRLIDSQQSPSAPQPLTDLLEGYLRALPGKSRFRMLYALLSSQKRLSAGDPLR